ncbi:MAG: hypothetical protein AB3N23_10745 [Paracoccaceae bacterium]
MRGIKAEGRRASIDRQAFALQTPRGAGPSPGTAIWLAETPASQDVRIWPA